MKTLVIAAAALTLGLTLQLVKPGKRGKKQPVPPTASSGLSNIQKLLSDLQALRSRAHLQAVQGAGSVMHTENRMSILKLLHDKFTTEII